MLDISYIRTHAKEVRQAALNKNSDVDIDELLRLDEERRSLQQQLDTLRQKKNVTSAVLGKPSATTIVAGRERKQQIQTLESQAEAITKAFRTLHATVPNMPAPEVPVGLDAAANQVLRQVGELPQFTFTPQPHWVLGERLGVIDSQRAGKISGSRFSYLLGPLVQIQFALVQHALEVLTDQEKLQEIAAGAQLDVATTPFIPVLPPVFIRPEIMQQMDRLEPKDDRYYIESDDLYLIGSAEHTLGPLHLQETIPVVNLPLRYVGYSTSFRREAGSHGKDVRGILRQHQFDKLEIESFTTSATSDVEQLFIVAIQEYLLKSLGLVYQVVINATGDMGKPDYRQFDIETWMAGQQTYRETHSSDHMTDYQARRLQTKVQLDTGNEYVHMNDATVFAMGRMLIAIMEHYQQADGSIAVPPVLHQYLPFTTIKDSTKT